MLIIQNGIVLDKQSSEKQKVKDLWIDKGLIIEPLSQIPNETQIIDAQDCWVLPGLVDIHSNLCDPGFNAKESITSGSKAAIAGGYTKICCTPNTKPVADCVTILEYVKGKAKEESKIDILPMACATKAMKGKEIVEMESLFKSGAVAFYDTQPYSDLKLFKIILQYAASIGAVVVSNPENRELSLNGLMHQGEWAIKLGLDGIPEEAETSAIASQIEILRQVPRAKLHFAAISSVQSVELIRRAKEDNLSVTSSVAPHHLLYTEASIGEYNTQLKVKPPLREEKDRLAIIQGLLNGVIDCIASHHEPQNFANKHLLFQDAAFGMVSLETCFSLFLEKICNSSLNKLCSLIDCFTAKPAQCLNIKATSLGFGQTADVIIVNPNLKWTYSKDSSYSQSFNSPLLNSTLKGKVIHNIKNGELIWSHSPQNG
ncbi:MAG: dihydroorotase [Candidatus Caenarcaniphilales bacterium]|nr:dihydroorotase [Candidatus Caenarcaniphilales bacterium]